MCLVVRLSHEFSLFLGGVLSLAQDGLEFLQYGVKYSNLAQNNIYTLIKRLIG